MIHYWFFVLLLSYKACYVRLWLSTAVAYHSKLLSLRLILWIHWMHYWSFVADLSLPVKEGPCCRSWMLLLFKWGRLTGYQEPGQVHRSAVKMEGVYSQILTSTFAWRASRTNHVGTVPYSRICLKHPISNHNTLSIWSPRVAKPFLNATAAKHILGAGYSCSSRSHRRDRRVGQRHFFQLE